MMIKKVASFSLDEETIKRLDTESKAFGMNKSEMVELMLQRGWHFSSKDMEESAKEIAALQEKAKKKHLGDQNEK